MHYKCILVKKLLVAMDSNAELKITVLDAMKWLKQSWDEVTESTIKNCFQHCGFVNTNGPLCEDPQRDDPTLQSLYIQLQQRGARLDGTVEDFECSDEAIETTGILSDQEIVNFVRGVEEEGEEHTIDEHNEPISCPSLADYRSALAVVSRYVACWSEDSRHEQALLALEDLSFKAMAKQTNIKDFLGAATGSPYIVFISTSGM